MTLHHKKFIVVILSPFFVLLVRVQVCFCFFIFVFDYSLLSLKHKLLCCPSVRMSVTMSFEPSTNSVGFVPMFPCL